MQLHPLLLICVWSFIVCIYNTGIIDNMLYGLNFSQSCVCYNGKNKYISNNRVKSN